MTSEQARLANLVAALMVLALSGLLVRRRAHLWWSFTALLVASIAGNLLTTTWPERFFRWNFWAWKEALYSGLFLAMAFELALKLFASTLPRARLQALTVACAASVLTAAVVAIAADGTPRNALGAVLPTLRAGGAWLMTLLLAIAVYYHIPLHQFHKVVLVGTALHHCVFVGLTGLQGMAGQAEMLGVFNAIEPAVFGASVGLWAYAAWRPEPAPALSPATATLLQPWAAR